MEFRMNVTVEVNRQEDAITVKVPVPLQIVYQSGRWQAQSADPPVLTDFVESLEEALVGGVKEVMAEIQTGAGMPGG